MPDNSVLIAVADGLGGGVSGDYAAETKSCLVLENNNT